MIEEWNWKALVGLLASGFSTLCQLVGIQLCVQIIRKGATDLMSPVPFIAFFVGACLWTKYGLMQNDANLVLSNIFALLLQLVYIGVFYVYTIKKSHFYRLLTVGAVILFLPLIYVQYFENDPAVGVHHLGLVCCCMSVCCTGSPLATLRDVLRTKSTESMSFLLCFFNFVAALAWFVYGLLLKDSFIIIPNIIGGILGLTQVILFCIYPTSLVLQKPTDAVLTI
ncbi:sugar transporter SWEET1-like isoform X1 [Pomacea canaliculata]|uniref:sugar transporter SWEET1-like isoform X1 n=1 Tax=Pomacea canaliculata TaxID=400727 RepID=UPI000D73872C|nr:sugar transporter SWEET1-like isoform X1 [Pomacea canaliculata]XP_025093650.1 sugar transporter SWEET1-like isoform X1 [Pomacea canaliculata]XP_025093651.1 sugar transporter SWEET1-like isoform X1 [Pomacea canaliculata]XP_025093652.1 sugar transporter SWEET1-like isoform X1 [Pomacea canaliculata]